MPHTHSHSKEQQWKWEDVWGGATTGVYRRVGQCAAVLMQLALSRSREFLTDACGACLTYNPLALARALRKCAE
jgi:Zn-dependent protease with chaperone function